jgi:hypothetical protein
VEGTSIVGHREDSQLIDICYTEEEQYSGCTAMNAKNHTGLGSTALRQGQGGLAKSEIWSLGHKAVNHMKGFEVGSFHVPGKNRGDTRSRTAFMPKSQNSPTRRHGLLATPN